MHAAALIDLLYGSDAGKSLQRAISSVQTAARLADRPAPMLADLAAAYLVRAERDNTPRDLLAAIEAAEEALEWEPRNRVALYNLALALQRFGLVEEAAQAWRSYLAVDAGSAWATSARQQLRVALAIDAPPPPPAPYAPVAAYEAYAAADPQGGRELGWCRVLGAWAEASLAGDAGGASAHLRRAEALGSALEGRPGGDATLSDGVRAIRTQTDPARSRRLARAHREFAAGCRVAERADFPNGIPIFAAAIAAADDSPILKTWARVLYGDMMFHSGDVRAGEAMLRATTHEIDPDRHPALAARARQSLTALLLRGDRYDAGLEQARQAVDLFARASERQNEGIMRDAMASARFFVRDMDQGYTLVHGALDRLGSYRSSYRLHNLLNLAARVVHNDGFPRAALRIQNEGVRVAERTRNPVFVAEARLQRARLRAGLGAVARATEDLAAGKGAVAELREPKVRAWMNAQRQLAEAATSLRGDAPRATTALDSAAAFFLGMHAPLVAFPAVVDAASARLGAGEVAGAIAGLESALGILEQRRDSIRIEPRRAAVFEAARSVVDRVVMLHLAAGREAEALGYLDRGRASLAPTGPVVAGADRAVAGPPGEVVLEYALVGDTLLAWTVAGRRVSLFRSVVDTMLLARTITRVRQQLEDLAGEPDLRPALSHLYDWLIRPLQGRLGAAGVPLVVIADGGIASIPFAALYDTAQGRYLMEDHPLRFAANLGQARREVPRGHARGVALFVADPAFNRAQHPGFERLPEAAGEVDTVAPAYPGARILVGAEASEPAFTAALGQAGMVHYAGHAIFDDERPERSDLLLAASPGQDAPATLQADEIAQLDLRHLSLVVLSACQTVRTGQGRAAGFSGLAGAFLAAGAGGAVGSLWEVNDRLTRPLMLEFHHAYRGSGNGPAALRTAQLRLLRSPDAALRSPAAWAGFRYLGS